MKKARKYLMWVKMAPNSLEPLSFNGVIYNSVSLNDDKMVSFERRIIAN